MIASIVLLPNTEDSLELKQQSQRIMGSLPFVFTPHITVLQFDTDRDPHDLIPDVARFSREVTTADGIGLNFLPIHEEQDLWIEVLIAKTEQLVELQRNVLNGSSYFKEARLCHAPGNDFRPHITVGRCGLADIAKLTLDIDSSLVCKHFTRLDLVVAINGENFTVAEVLR